MPKNWFSWHPQRPKLSSPPQECHLPPQYHHQLHYKALYFILYMMMMAVPSVPSISNPMTLPEESRILCVYGELVIPEHIQEESISILYIVFIINSFFWIYLFIIHWIIFIFSIPKQFIYLIFLLDVLLLFMYFLFLVNVIVYLLFYHWISILCNDHTSPQKNEKYMIRILYKPPSSRSSWSKITFASMKVDCSISNVYFNRK